MESRRAQRAEVGRLDSELVFYGKLGFQRGDCRGHERSKGHLEECQQFQMRIQAGFGIHRHLVAHEGNGAGRKRPAGLRAGLVNKFALLSLAALRFGVSVETFCSAD